MATPSKIPNSPSSGDLSSLTIDCVSLCTLNGMDGAQELVVLSVQQPSRGWTIYRRLATFQALSYHLTTQFPHIPPCPPIPYPPSQLGSLSILPPHVEGLMRWMNEILLLDYVRDTPVMTNFLTAEANLAPPGLDIQWSKHASAFEDEMEMDEMFDRHLDEHEDDGAFRLHQQQQHTVFHIPTSGGSTGWHTAEPGVAHSFTARNGFVGGDDSGFDSDLDGCDDAELMPESLPDYSPSLSSSSHALAHSDHQQQETPPLPPMMEAATNGHTPAGDGIGAAVQTRKKYSLDSFQVLRVIGKGSFGKVFLVRERETNTIYAMKVLRKENVIKRNQIEHTRTERSVLGYVSHPFIVGLNMAFQTREKLFFVLDYCAGGELFFHLGKVGKFPEVRARFYAAEITLALGYVHSLEVIYRDLKPENVLLDDRGHVRLTDFGLSKEGVSQNESGANSFCGTPEYLAPEILNRQGHGRAVDWWSLGALLYEMLTGLPPFYCQNREKLFEKIRSAELTFPNYTSRVARSILSGLLTRNPRERLGAGESDADEVKAHPFFAGLDWERLAQRQLPPPWEPAIVGSLDTSQFDLEFTSMPIASPDTHESRLQGSSADNFFAGFSYTDSSGHLPQHRR